MSSPVAFIIGAGVNVGQYTAAALKAKGYKVALGSRKPDQTKNDGFFRVAVEAQHPESIQAAFAKVNAELGVPSVVICNGYKAEEPADVEDPLTLSVESITAQTAVGLGVFVAAQEYVRGARAGLPQGTPKTFIATGNPLPWAEVAERKWLGLSVQKLVQWRLIEQFAASYSKENFRFYFATLVGETGGVIEPLSDFWTSGPQHAKVFTNLVTRKDQADWDYRFTLDTKQWKE
ncbi:hypothetical protein C8J57DRAFT_1494822 [Mycena rebaudengoi]|nr:hypothetical protein C8J57DRAFT_1494822 [Mycena rebaudengoi]